MDLLDKVLLEWSARTDKGYPDLNNKQDLALFESMFGFELNEQNLVLEQSKQYDDHIIQALGKIPTVHGKYRVPAGSGNIDVHSDDLEAYKRIFKLSPDQTIGPGELSIYWLFQHQASPVNTSDTRGGDDPDLQIGDKKVEIKAYGGHTGKIKLGKFASQKSNVRLLNIVFGFHSLVKILNLESSKKAITSTNFNPKELLLALQDIFRIKDSGIFAQEAQKFELISSIKDKLDLLDEELGSPSDPEEAAKAVLSRIVMSKFKTKPGDEGYIASATIEGSIHFFYIDFDKLRQADLLNLVAIPGGEIAVDFKSIFG